MRAPRLPSKLHQPFPKRGVESPTLSLCGKTSGFNEILIGAKSDVLHTEIVYASLV